jgi:hypothetical protein
MSANVVEIRTCRTYQRNRQWKRCTSRQIGPFLMADLHKKLIHMPRKKQESFATRRQFHDYLISGAFYVGLIALCIVIDVLFVKRAVQLVHFVITHWPK